mgnify:CR=1 FL=1
MKWYQSKTNWTALVAVIAAVGAYLTGEIDAVTTVQSIFAAVIAIFLRRGVAKSGPEA